MIQIAKFKYLKHPHKQDSITSDLTLETRIHSVVYLLFQKYIKTNMFIFTLSYNYVVIQLCLLKQKSYLTLKKINDCPSCTFYWKHFLGNTNRQTFLFLDHNLSNLLLKKYHGKNSYRCIQYSKSCSFCLKMCSPNFNCFPLQWAFAIKGKHGSSMKQEQG